MGKLFLIFTCLFLFGPLAEALERARAEQSPLSSTPATVIRLEKKTRGLASVSSREEQEKKTLDELSTKLPIGSYAMVQRSIYGWNDEVVKVVAIYEDGRRKIQRENGEFALVEYKNLHMLSPESKSCCKAGASEVCPGDQVYYPAMTVALGVTEGRAKRIFENCAVEVQDGVSTLFEASQLGKPVDCSPQKESVCVGKTVLVVGWRNGNRYEFEGKVEKAYSEGTILVRTGSDLFPIEANSAVVRTESLGDSTRAPASTAKLPTLPEVELFDAKDRVRETNVFER